MNLYFVLDFLKDLAINNNKEWFAQNRERYNMIRKEAENFVDLIKNEIHTFDPHIPNIDAKSCMYRINKDARFTDPAEGPYKENIGAFISKGGKTGSFPGYYIHIEPGACSLEGGIYSPESPILSSLRSEISNNFDEFNTIVTNKAFIRFFNKVEGKSLVKVPRQYSVNHPASEYLKMKSLTVFHSVSDEMVCSNSFPQYATDVFKAMSPLIQFMNDAIDNIE